MGEESGAFAYISITEPQILMGKVLKFILQ